MTPIAVGQIIGGPVMRTDLPVAEFSACPISGIAPLKVKFTDKSQDHLLPGVGALEMEHLQKPKILYIDTVKLENTLSA